MDDTDGLVQDASRRTLLVVDDMPENLAVLGDVLMPEFRVRVASSGERALAAAASEPRPDLVLLDVMMPGMDGYEVLRRLRADPATAQIPVIFVTALDAVQDEAHGLALGAVDYIAKPFSPPIVLARVRTQLELKEARDKLRDENAWLEAEVQRRVRQQRVVQDVSLRALASLAEVRDPDTGAHILRTQGYVRLLGQELAKLPKYASVLTPAVIEAYVKAAPLHDIGKVGIPDRILHKPGSLTPEEWEVMKTHAALGANAIRRAIVDEEDRSALDFLNVAMDIAQNHHERWDGGGYPQGLRGDAIPLSARMMAVADMYDALINARVYKPAFTLEKVLQTIVAARGTHLDPEVVDAFVRRSADFSAIAERYAVQAAPDQAAS
jgi:putative two-component system response regulator